MTPSWALLGLSLCFAAVDAFNATNRQRILITGSSDGIGRVTAFQLARDFPQVPLVLHGKTRQRCNNVTAWLERKLPGVSDRLDCVVGDFTRLAQVELMAARVRRRYSNLDTVLLNAGIFPRGHTEQTSHGLDETFQVNHLAHLLLLDRLLPLLANNTPSRFVFTASGAHYWARDPATWDDFQSNKSVVGIQPTFLHFDSDDLLRYGRSKLYNIMSGMEAAAQAPSGVSFVSAHPGHWQTKLSAWTGRPVEEVRVIAYLASEPTIDDVSPGAYFDQYVRGSWSAALGQMSAIAQNAAFRRRLWSYSLDLLRDLGYPLRSLV